MRGQFWLWKVNLAPLGVLALRLGLEPALLGGGSRLAASPLPAEKSSSSFVAEVVLGLLLAIIILVLVAAGGWYWLKRRGLASGMPAESNAPQGFDNITFRDVRPGVKGFPTCPQPRQNSIFLKAQQIPAGSP